MYILLASSSHASPQGGGLKAADQQQLLDAGMLLQGDLGYSMVGANTMSDSVYSAGVRDTKFWIQRCVF
jgi:hypothetical protein